MGWSYRPNLAPATSAEAVFNIKQHLKSLGWLVPQSSDGSTYLATGDQISHAGSGANGLNNSLAWFEIRQPGPSARSWVWQSAGADRRYWRTKYSPSAGFSGGTPSATQVPSATDEGVLLGSGTDASPTGTLWIAADTTYRQHIGGDDAAPYGFYVATILIGGGLPSQGGAWLVDPLASGSYPSATTDPLMQYIDGTTSPWTAADLSAETGGATSSAAWAVHQDTTLFRVSGLVWKDSGGTQIIPGGIATPDGDIEGLPVVWARRTAAGGSVGHHGTSTVLKWTGTPTTTGNLVTLSGVDRLVVGDTNLPWPQGVSPVV